MSRRTRFVWLPDQPLQHARSFATLRGAALRREDEGVNRWVLARRRFHLPAAALAARLHLTVDGRYRAWLNGRRIGDGPARSSPWYKRFDQLEVGSMLEPGANVLAVLIHVPGVDLANYECTKGGWQPALGDGGLFAELLVGTADGVIDAVNHEGWRVRASSAWRRDAPRAGWGQDFIEDVDAAQWDESWVLEPFDDRDWREARILRATGDASAQARGWGPVEPFPILVPSVVPLACESILLPRRLEWVRGVEPMPALPLEERLYREPVLEVDASLAPEAAGLLARDPPQAGACTVRTAKGKDTALMFSFERCHAGRPFIELDAQGGEIIEVAVAESLPGEFGIGTPGEGLRRRDGLHCSQMFRYVARPGRQYFEKFSLVSIRAMQLVVRDAPAGVRILRIGSVASHYPAQPDCSFDCSDAVLSRIWEVSRHTLLQCMQDAWIDCPGREQRQWVGDAVVEFDVAASTFGPSAYPLQRQFLEQTAEAQRPDGLVRMFAPGDSTAEMLTIPDYTLLWIIGAWRYYRISGDGECLERLLPAIEKALAWFSRASDAHSLLVDVPHWQFIEWAAIGRDGWPGAINALWVGALDACAHLADGLGRSGLSRSCRELRSRIATALNEKFWDSRRGVYVDSVDPDSGEPGARVSQHTNALMLLFDIALPERRQGVLEAITDRSRLKLTAAPPIAPTAPPFDETVDIVKANTFFAHFVYDAIAAAGKPGWVVEEIRERYGAMLAAGATTWWETFSPQASLCHGFSATPAYQLSRHVLGVQPATPSFEQVQIQPDPASLTWAKGTLATVRGDISVDWRLEDGALLLTVKRPAGCDVSVVAPHGFRLAWMERTGEEVRARIENAAGCLQR